MDTTRRALAGALAAMLLTTGAWASDFRAPIRFVVPAAAGGATDVVARLLAPRIAQELGQTVIVDNKPGASGQIAAQYVQGAPADGSVLLFSPDHGMIVVPLTTPAARYDVFKDFIALGQAFRFGWAFSVSATGPVKDLNGLLDGVRQDPALRSYGVPLPGGVPELIGEALGRRAGVAMTAVPFNGAAPMLPLLIGGQVPAGVTGVPEAIQMHKTGKARILAIAGNQRSSLVPDVPTFRELGMPEVTVRTFFGFFAPRGLPGPMAEQFNAALRKALDEPAVQHKLADMSLEAAPTTLAEAAAEVATAHQFWKTALAAKK